MAMPRVTSNQQKVKDWRNPLVQVCKYIVLNLSRLVDLGKEGWGRGSLAAPAPSH